mmetsp:Transcript_15653/g.27038  ORF Transcript_15653/g.27038 Transcript_15653/m.27038 type:complete len:86 (+) Transcript_15653:67-324(+)
MATPSELAIAEKWDAAIERTLTKLFYGALGGGAAGLLLCRSKAGRVASLAFGAGVGVGHAYFETQEDFKRVEKITSKEPECAHCH